MEKKDNKVKADVKKNKTKATENQTIVYSGIGDYGKTGHGPYIGLYSIVLTKEFNRLDYKFDFYNFSSTNHNRIVIHMHRTASGNDVDFSTYSNPILHPIEIPIDTIPNYETSTLRVTQSLKKTVDVEIILYHNDALDSILEGKYNKDIRPTIPNKFGQGTLKKI